MESRKKDKGGRIKLVIKSLLFLVIFSSLVTSINCDLFNHLKCNCDDKMEEIRNKMGPPEEVNRYDTSDYHNVDWWYWSKGICYTFEWGSIVDKCCEVSTYQFEPIEGENIQMKKDSLKKEKQSHLYKSFGPLKIWNILSKRVLGASL